MSSQKSSLGVMSWVLFLFIATAVITAAVNGRMQLITDASFQAAKDAVTLAIGLVGIMALWLGVMRVLEAGGALEALANSLKPLMVRLFPDVPADHPAMGGMLLNISANMLGLGNAATPFGIRAMQELQRLNPFRDTATNAMCLFLAINTSSVTILPLGAIGVRAAAGATNPAGIFLPTLIAHTTATIVGVTVALLCARADKKWRNEYQVATAEARANMQPDAIEETVVVHNFRFPPGKAHRMLACVIASVMFGLMFAQIYINPAPLHFFATEILSHWLMPFLMLGVLTFGLYRGVRIYDAVTDGAKQGFEVALRIIPFLVTILVAIAMFRAAGGMEFFAQLLSPVLTPLGVPADVLPMIILRPLSGSGAFAVLGELTTHAPNSYSAYLSAVIMGSTETTFYVLAVYFGAVGVSKVRYALLAALAADIAGMTASCIVAPHFF